MASGNLKIEQQLNKAIAARARLMKQISAEMQSQAQLQAGLTASMSGASVDEAIEKMKIFSQQSKQAMDSLSNASQQSGDAFKLTAQAMADADKGIAGIINGTQSFVKTNKKAIVGLTLLAMGYNKLKTFVKAATERTKQFAITSFASIKRVGKAIIMTPFRMLKGLMNMAASGGGGTELAEAYNGVRKEFGALKDGMGALVIQASKNLRPALVGTGLSVRKVFGNLAERIKAVSDLIKGLGPLAISFSNELAGAGAGKIAVFQKGLGLSEEGLRAFAIQAKVSGKTLEKQLSEVNNLAQQLGPKFAGSAKIMARKMGDLKKMPQFIQMSNKELAEMVAYTSQLGAEADALSGLADTFDTFEGAANAANNLNQAFGIQVDYLEMMKEQDPTKRLEMLRKSMKAAGRDTENLSRGQLKSLAASVGMTEANAKLLLSEKNRGKSLEDIKKASKDAEKKPLSQAEAMGKLADSIDRMIKSGAQMQGGFFGPLIQGFTRAFQMMPPFQNLMKAIKRFQFTMRRVGADLGRIIGSSGPFGKFFGGIMKGFDQLTSILNKFSDNIDSKGVEDAFEIMMDDLEGMVNNFFNKDGPGDMIVKGLEGMFGRAIQWLGEKGLPMMAEKLVDALNNLADFLDPKKTKDGLPGEQAGESIFAPIFRWLEKASEDGGTLDQLGKAMKKLMINLFKWLRKHKVIEKFVGNIQDAAMIAFNNLSFSEMITLWAVMSPSSFLMAGSMLMGSLSTGLVAAFKAWRGRKAKKALQESLKRMVDQSAKEAGKQGSKVAKDLTKQPKVTINRNQTKLLQTGGKEAAKRPGVIGRAFAKMAQQTTKAGRAFSKALPAMSKSLGRFGAQALRYGRVISKGAGRAGGPLALAMAVYDGYQGMKKYGPMLDGQLDARGKKIKGFQAKYAGAWTGVVSGAAEPIRLLAKAAAAGMDKISEGSGDKFFGFLSDDKQWERAKSETAEGIALITNDVSAWAKKQTKLISSSFSDSSTKVKETFSWENISEKFNNISTNIKTWASDSWCSITQPFSDAVTKVKETFSWEKIRGVFDSISDGIKQKMSNIGEDLTSPFKNWFRDAKKAVNAQSPSKDSEQIGSFLRQGLVKGFGASSLFGEIFNFGEQSNVPDLENSIGKIMSGYITSFNTIGEKLKSNGMSTQATKTIKAVVAEINAISEELQTVDGPTLAVSLKNFAMAANQDVKGLSLKRSNTSVTFRANVYIDSEQLLTNLTRGEIVFGPNSEKRSIQMTTPQERDKVYGLDDD